MPMATLGQAIDGGLPGEKGGAGALGIERITNFTA